MLLSHSFLFIFCLFAVSEQTRMSTNEMPELHLLVWQHGVETLVQCKSFHEHTLLLSHTQKGKKRGKKLKEQINTELKAETMSEIRERRAQIPSFFLAQILKFFTFRSS